MLDIKRIRENLEDIKKAMDRRGEKEFDLDAVVALDDKRRELLKEVEVMKNELNVESKKIPQLIKEGKDITEDKANLKKLSDEIKSLDEKIKIKKSKSDIKEFAESSTEMFGGEKEEIEAICHIWLLDTIFETFGRNVTIKKIPKDDDHFKLIVDTNSMGFRMWAMRNVDLVEVKKPLHLREEMKKIVKNAFEKYNT